MQICNPYAELRKVLYLEAVYEWWINMLFEWNIWITEAIQQILPDKFTRDLMAKTTWGTYFCSAVYPKTWLVVKAKLLVDSGWITVVLCMEAVIAVPFEGNLQATWTILTFFCISQGMVSLLVTCLLWNLEEYCESAGMWVQLLSMAKYTYVWW